MTSNNSFPLPKGTYIDKRWLIVEKLSQGGFGFTYKAIDTKMESDVYHPKNYVVVKELFAQALNKRNPVTQRVELLNPDSLDSFPQFNKLKRLFVREAQRMYQLHNSHIVRVNDFVENENGTAYYMMDFVKGDTLSQYIRDHGRPLPEARALKYIRQLCQALQIVHENNLLHLDVKPGNMMLNEEEDNIVLIDFGASKVIDRSDSEGNTTTGMFYTKYYAAPEQIANDTDLLCPRTDLYAVGATLYKLLTGEQPPEFSKIQQFRTLESTLAAKNKPLPPSISRRTRELLNMLMAPTITDRPADAEAVIKYLDDKNADISSVETKSLEDESNWASTFLEDKDSGPNPPGGSGSNPPPGSGPNPPKDSGSNPPKDSGANSHGDDDTNVVSGSHAKQDAPPSSDNASGQNGAGREGVVNDTQLVTGPHSQSGTSQPGTPQSGTSKSGKSKQGKSKPAKPSTQKGKVYLVVAAIVVAAVGLFSLVLWSSLNKNQTDVFDLDAEDSTSVFSDTLPDSFDSPADTAVAAPALPAEAAPAAQPSPAAPAAQSTSTSSSRTAVPAAQPSSASSSRTSTPARISSSSSTTVQTPQTSSPSSRPSTSSAGSTVSPSTSRPATTATPSSPSRSSVSSSTPSTSSSRRATLGSGSGSTSSSVSTPSTPSTSTGGSTSSSTRRGTLGSGK